ncbi:inosine/xanthosine triphosphatase [Halobacteria archaeon AArc-dxtr1]|nr:inosine/xanthosine triphosphatase [Halobacteria archaeon AArc-dxtr1]
MHVAVGSTNPVKVTAVADALESSDPTTVPVAVDSGVSEQPTSVAETVRGARTRAKRALESVADANFGVGLEGGVAEYEGADGLFLIMWASATDGDRVEVGGGPSLRLPEPVVRRLEAGAELGPVMDALLGTEGIAEREGAAGVLTGGRVDRAGALETAVTCAFGPFLTDHYRQ